MYIWPHVIKIYIDIGPPWHGLNGLRYEICGEVSIRTLGPFLEVDEMRVLVVIVSL
jgi:hypothetical protein